MFLLCELSFSNLFLRSLDPNDGSFDFFLYNFIRMTVVLVTVVAAPLEHVNFKHIIDRFMAELGRAGWAWLG